MSDLGYITHCSICREPHRPQHPGWYKHATRAECIAALRATLDQERTGVAPGWQPIDSAPRDGTRVIVHDKIAGTLIAQWGWGDWYCHETRSTLWPECWQPLPAAPTAQGEGGGE